MSSLTFTQAFPRLLVTLAISTYGLYLSYHNIIRLQAYEKQSEKAAEWSNTAAERLRKTRTTQAAGTIVLIVSFLLSFVYLTGLFNASLPIISLLLSALLFFSRSYMASFWNSKTQTKIPFVEKFNKAIRGSEIVVSVLGLLSFAWGWAGVIWLLEGSWTATGHLFWGLPVGAFAFIASQTASENMGAR